MEGPVRRGLPRPTCCPAFIICGLGLGASFVPLQISAFAGSEEHESGLAAGLINTCQEIGGALGLAVAATYAFRRIDELEAQSKGVPELVDQARTTVFHDAFLISAGFAAAGLLVTLVLLPLTRAKDLPTGAPVA